MSDPDPPLFVFFNEIGIIEQLARNRFERLLPDGLRLPHFSVLTHCVRLGDDRSPAELARAFQVTRGAMTNTIQRLEARGLVDVRPDPADGRGKRVFITEQGKLARDRAIAALGPALAELGEVFSEAAFAKAIPFLQVVRAYLDRARDADA